MKVLTRVSQQYAKVKTEVSARMLDMPWSSAPNPSTPSLSPVINLAEAIHLLDDGSVRKLFGMGPALTEDELREFVESSNKDKAK